MNIELAGRGCDDAPITAHAELQLPVGGGGVLGIRLNRNNHIELRHCTG
jgi:hypothetical protein